MKSARAKKIITQVAALTLVSVTLAACDSSSQAEVGQGLDDITKRAKTEMELVVYSSATDEINEGVVSAFNKEHPDIKVKVTRLASGDLKSRFAAETSSGAQSADLIIVTDPLMFEQDPEWFVRLSEEQVPNLTNLRDDFVADDYFGVVASPWVVTYNTKKLSKAPQKWADLADPVYAGRETLADPKISPDSVMSFYEILMDEYGPGFLKTLGAQNKDWFESSVPAIQKVAAGQVALAAPGAKAHSTALQVAGAPVKTVVPEPVVAFTNLAGVAAKAEHPNAAMLFANFLLSKQGQSAFCGDALYMALIKESIPSCPAAPKDIRLADPARANKNHDKILASFGLD